MLSSIIRPGLKSVTLTALERFLSTAKELKTITATTGTPIKIDFLNFLLLDCKTLSIRPSFLLLF